MTLKFKSFSFFVSLTTLNLLLLCAPRICGQQQTPVTGQQTPLNGQQVAERVSPSVVLILTGNSTGELQGVGSGLAIKSNGLILTAYHLIKNAEALQVRLKDGEVYDKVELIGTDERRDVAALRIPATGLSAPAVVKVEEAQIGEKVFTISNAEGLSWSTSEGSLSGLRLADEIPGAGKGYRLLQFSAPVSQGSSGGALVDEHGQVLGMIVASGQGQNLNFAVPLSSVAGLTEGSSNVIKVFGSGKTLELEKKTERSPVASVIANSDPKALLANAKLIHIQTSTTYFDPVLLQRELEKQPAFGAAKMLMIGDNTNADITISIDRPLFTFNWTYQILDGRTKLILGSGKVVSFDSTGAAPKLAKEIIKKMTEARTVASGKGERIQTNTIKKEH